MKRTKTTGLALLVGMALTSAGCQAVQAYYPAKGIAEAIYYTVKSDEKKETKSSSYDQEEETK